jgi:DNA gyrase subunit A
VKDEKIKGIADIRDESDREGIRVVVEIKRGENGEVVLNQLYKHTPMDTSFGIIMLALVRNQPRVLPLKDLIGQFIEHRKEVVTKRTQYELRKAEERLHLLDGLKIALDHLDEVIALIRKSESPQEAKEGLMSKLSLSDKQAQAILDMRLQRLTALEREKIIEERNELIKTVDNLKEILQKEQLILGIIISELEDIKNRYGDERRTEIIDSVEEISLEDLIADEDMVVTITHEGYIKNTPLSVYRSQRRGGKGKTGMTTKDTDFMETIFVASTHSYVLFFSNLGKCYWLKVHEIPEAGPTAKGKAIVNLLNLSSGENIAAVLPVREFKKDQFVIMATKKGIVKKTELMAYSNPRVGGIVAVNVRDDDELIGAGITSGGDDILLTTRFGQAIRFKEDEVRDMGRTATGVIGIRLDEGDGVVSLEVVQNPILTVAEMGYGKRTAVSEYRLTGRGGKGVMTIRTSDRNGRVVGAFQVTNDMQVILITTHGKVIRMEASQISVYGRGAQGLRLIELEPGEKVAAVAKVVERDQV